MSKKYPVLQPWIYVPSSYQPDGPQPCYNIQVPDLWAEQLAKLGETVVRLNGWKRPDPWIPYHYLSPLLLLTIPSLISNGFEEVHVQERPRPMRRLLTGSDPNSYLDTLAMMMKFWAQYHYDRQIKPGTLRATEARSILRDTLQMMDGQQLAAIPYTVDLRCPELDSQYGSSNMLRSTYFKAIPAWLIAQLKGRPIAFRNYESILQRAQSMSGKPELITWPPYQTNRGYYVSLVLEFSVLIWPGVTPTTPRIFPRWHVRRWISEPVRADNGFIRLPSDQNSTVYLRTRVPWIDQIVQDADPTAFTVAPVALAKIDTEWQAVWAYWLPEMLEGIRARPLPMIDNLLRAPLQVAMNEGGLDLGLVFSAKFYDHFDPAIGTGFFPPDRVELGQQTEEWLVALGLQPLYPQGIHSTWSIAPSRKKLPPAKVADGLIQAISSDAPLEIQSWYMNPSTAAQHWQFIKENFALMETGNDDVIFESGVEGRTAAGQSVRFKAMPNPYPSLSASRSAAELTSDIRGRVGLRTFAEKMAVLIELEHLGKEDAKAALRRILAHLNVHTQFQNPVSGTGEKIEEQRKGRARASVLEVRRQLGYLSDFTATLNETIAKAQLRSLEPGTEIIGLCFVQRNKPARRFPLAMKLTVGTRIGHVCMPDERGAMTGEWLPYSTASLEMVRREEISQKMDEGRVSVWLSQFLRSALNLATSTILLVPAAQLRRVWPWLEYENLTLDRMRIGEQIYLPEGRPHETGTVVAPDLRVLWYRADNHDEEAFYSTIQADCDKVRAGYGHGLWQIYDRHYVSIAPKADTYQPNSIWTRVGSVGERKSARMSQAVDIIPAFIQPGDDLDSLGMAFHALRASASHWTQGFVTDPLPNHLAELIVDDYLSLSPT